MRGSRNALNELQRNEVELAAQNLELHLSRLALEQAIHHYVDLYESAPVGYVTLSDGGLIQDANLTGAAMLRMERSALVGLPFARFVHPDQADGWSLQFRSLAGTGERRSFRIALRRSDGSALPTRVACEGRPDSDGKAVVRVVVTDISEQADIERALRESQERMSAVLDEFHDGYWHWSADSGQTAYSGRLATMLGIAEGGQGGEMPFDLSWAGRIHRDDLSVARMTAEDLLHGRQDRFDVEFRWHMPDGTGKWVRARGRVVRRNERGKAMRITGTLSDITENKHLRESLVRMEPNGNAGGSAARN